MKQVDTTWRELEINVTKLASFIWGSIARPEKINGVDFDVVVRSKADEWIIIEVTKDESLAKVRTDCAKIAAVRMHLFSKGIFCRCYLVMTREPTNDMKTTAEGNNLQIFSYQEFSSLFLDYGRYYFERQQRSFGSAVDPISGLPDQIDYTPVLYQKFESGETLRIDHLKKLLHHKKRIILLGNYGTGKSRCIRELFTLINEEKEPHSLVYSIAINLKENWGTLTAEEIIRRHFGQLGLSDLADPLLKVYERENVIFMLDGFDEIGSQSWSNNTSRLEQIRASSLLGVKDLISKVRGPIIITGREHYFNSQTEMYRLLGIDQKDAQVFRCKDEFSEAEMKRYMRSISGQEYLPKWLPRRPLVCQIINSLDKSTFREIFQEGGSSVVFFHTLIDKLCDREARIHGILDAFSILRILMLLAKLTRERSSNVGPLSIGDLNKAFEEVTGTPPVDEAATMLQRLPALGRVGSESTDRQFIDYFILDGLRAQHLIACVKEHSMDVTREQWFNPLGELGVELIAREISDTSSHQFYFNVLRNSLNESNKIIPGDLFAALAKSVRSEFDMESITIHSTHIKFLNLSDTGAMNFSIQDSIIEELILPLELPVSVFFCKCIIYQIRNYRAEHSVLFIECNIEHSDHGLRQSTAQQIFESIIRKLFYSSAAGLGQEALSQGFSGPGNKRLLEGILNILVRENVIDYIHDGHAWIYRPIRSQTKRVNSILSNWGTDNDELCAQINGI